MARNLTRSGPMSEMVRSGLFPSIDDFFRDFPLAPALRGMGMDQMSRMRVDVEDTDQAYIMKADIPGVKKEDIQVSIEGNMVSIRSKQEQERSEQGGNMICNERVYGEDFRSFTLPQEVDDSKAEAKYENGVLMLTLPKKSGTGGKKLTVQ